MKKICYLHLEYEKTTFLEQLDFASFDVRKRHEDSYIDRFVLAQSADFLKLDNLEDLATYDEIIFFVKSVNQVLFVFEKLRKYSNSRSIRFTGEKLLPHLIKWENWYSERFGAIYGTTNKDVNPRLNFYFHPLEFSTEYFRGVKDVLKTSIILNIVGLTVDEISRVYAKFWALDKVFRKGLKVYICGDKPNMGGIDVLNIFEEVCFIPSWTMPAISLAFPGSFLFLDFCKCESVEDLEVSKILRMLSIRFECLYYGTYPLAGVNCIRHLDEELLLKFLVVENIRKEYIENQQIFMEKL